MSSLELKLPPPLIALLCAAAMGALAHWLPGGAWNNPLRLPLTILLALAGGATDLSALIAFRRHHTTVNPLAPQRSSAIVQTGVYRFSRNPMYLGMALLLSAGAMWLSNGWCWLPVALFLAAITRLQILPEERILRARFGAPYQAYLQRVRRWL